jgi:hypothetical protein
MRWIEQIGERSRHCERFRFERPQKGVRIDLIRALADGNAGGGQIERRRDCRCGSHDLGGVVASAPEPVQQRRSAERNAHGVERRIGLDTFANRREHRADFLVIAGMIGARPPIQFAAATAKMRHDAAPADRRKVCEKRARIMRLRVSFQPVEEHDERCRRRGGRIEPIEVPEIAVCCFDALATQFDRCAP